MFGCFHKVAFTCRSIRTAHDVGTNDVRNVSPQLHFNLSLHSVAHTSRIHRRSHGIVVVVVVILNISKSVFLCWKEKVELAGKRKWFLNCVQRDCLACLTKGNFDVIVAMMAPRQSLPKKWIVCNRRICGFACGRTRRGVDRFYSPA